MEETTVVKPTGSSSPAGSPRRLAVWGLSLAAVAFVIGLGMARAAVGLGAALGCVVAAVYAWRYITSHLSMARRERIVEPRLIRSTTVRILLLAVVSASVFLLGRDVFIAYLAAFALALAVLLFAEAPRVMRQLRSG
jgi:hypothetical protein